MQLTAKPEPQAARIDVYFWEPTLSPHKVPLLNALGRRAEVGRTIYVSEGQLSSERISGGFPEGLRPDGELILSPNAGEVAAIIRDSSADSVHFFSGLHWIPCIVEGIRQAIRQGRFFGIMSEPRVLEGVKGKIRVAHSWATERRHRRNAKFVAAIGRHGPQWFRLTGYRAAVFPFAYFIDPPALDPPSQVPQQHSRLRIGYIGRLVEAKGFGIFLRMIEEADGRFDFVIAGAGNMAETAKRVAARHKNVLFMGVLPMAEVPRVMAGLDCLLVPSLTSDDGWAVVVSESLLCGTYPIISGRVGASILAAHPRIGARVDSDAPSAYLDAIEAAASRQVLTQDGRSERSCYAKSHLTADAGADYLIRMLSHIRGMGPKPADFHV